MAEAIIRQAEDALRRGDIGAAKAAKRSLEYEILSLNRTDLIGSYREIYGRNAHIEKAGTHS